MRSTDRLIKGTTPGAAGDSLGHSQNRCRLWTNRTSVVVISFMVLSLVRSYVLGPDSDRFLAMHTWALVAEWLSAFATMVLFVSGIWCGVAFLFCFAREHGLRTQMEVDAKMQKERP